MLGFSIGPLLGGALTHFVGWRAIFWLNALVMLASAGGLLPASDKVAGQSVGRLIGFDWAGFLLLATLMTSLIFALRALPEVRSEPVAFAAPLLLAGAAFACLLQVERRVREPLLDLSLFGKTQFVRGVAISALSMFSILALLLYFNLDAQSPAGLDFTAIDAGLLLLPMSAGLLVFAFTAPGPAARLGLRNTLVCGMLLAVIASAIVAAAAADTALLPLSAGLFAIGAGLAVPDATGPRLALSALSPGQTGQDRQRMHVPWRQHRRRGRRCRLRARRLRGGDGGDGADWGRRHHRCLALPHNRRHGWYCRLTVHEVEAGSSVLW